MRNALRARRRTAAPLALAALLAASALAGGCNWWFAHPAEVMPAVPLVVENHGFHDVAVHVVRVPGERGTRVGTVTGNGRARLAVRRSMLAAGHQLVVRVQGIGTRRSWTSPAVPVAADAVAWLDVHEDADGGMARSTLYTVPAAAAPIAAAFR